MTQAAKNLSSRFWPQKTLASSMWQKINKKLHMKHNSILLNVVCSVLALAVILGTGCKRDVADLQSAGFPKIGEVFIDDFTGDLAYSAFGGSDVKAFQVDKKETYGGSAASMRFAVPDEQSPEGAFAGGVFFSKTGRDLSDFNALTFYIKSTQPANIGVIGFGNDMGSSKYQVSISGLAVNSNWKKVIIPIPDPSKLSAEKGLLYCSAGPENGRGYTFWIDEVRFEKLGTIGHGEGIILNGVDKQQVSYIGVNTPLDGFGASFNLPSGVNETLTISPYYFKFMSSNPAAATVNERGVVSTIGGGTAKITATLGDKIAKGSLTINSEGTFIGAPRPTKDTANVISVFSDAYPNINVDFYNGYWQPYQTTQSADFVVNGDNVLNYSSFNFVGIQVSSPTVNIGSKTNLHLDLYFPDELNAGANFKVRVVDFGADGVPGGNDDVSDIISFAAPTLVAKTWVSLDIPLSSLPLLTTKGHFGQIIFEGVNISNFFADNIYFWSNPIVPPTPAPVPTTAASSVLSIFSDTYTNVAGTDFNPNWGQSTIVTQTPIGGNNTLKYANFNYQGVQLGSPQNVSSYASLHLDYYSTNATQLKVYLISPGGVETPYTLPVPTAGWSSVNIPLSAFAPVALNNVIQLKFDGGGGSDIYLDNIYFYKPPTTPLVAAPVPTRPAADVLSIFSNTYTNVAGTDFNPNWGQTTAVTQTPIAGNTTLYYANFNYQGVQLGSNQDVSSYGGLHLDYYSTNATQLKVYLISPGGVETPYTLTVPTAGWNSVDIPLSAFAPVAMNNIMQMKFDGGTGSDVYLDNIYFYKGSGGGGGSCPTPPAGEFIVDGDFEANAGCWELIAIQGGTSSTIVTNVNNGGSNSARVKTAPAGNPGIKQTRFGVGTILPNKVYVVKFDIRADAADPVGSGSVLNVATFSEGADGSGTPAVRHNLISGEPNVSTTWTTKTLTFTTAANVDGGLSLLIELIGGGPTTTGTIYIDNVSLKAQ